jgi:hypothetical protein
VPSNMNEENMTQMTNMSNKSKKKIKNFDFNIMNWNKKKDAKLFEADTKMKLCYHPNEEEQ